MVEARNVQLVNAQCRCVIISMIAISAIIAIISMIAIIAPRRACIRECCWLGAPQILTPKER